MRNPRKLPREFFNRDPVLVARDLLGKLLVRIEDGHRISGIVTETEAYRRQEDLACHAKSGLTPRTEVMFGPPGVAYVYFTYGMHWMLNFVCQPEGDPNAVLLRGIHPVEGIDLIRERRKGRPRTAWTNGPAKICQALNIDKRYNGYDICAPDAELFVIDKEPIADINVTTGPRVGLNSVPEPWLSKPWRFIYHIDGQQDKSIAKE
jgi:DNA-3-methyladenine glycosylase